MHVQLQLRSSRTIASALSPTRVRPTSGLTSGRLGRIGAALSEVPPYLAATTIGSLAGLVLGVRGLFCGSLSREVCVPKDRVGLEIFR